jgi:ATP-dependent protease ClpP protease subunit
VNRNTPWRTTRGNRLLALASGDSDWYRIRNATASMRAQIHIYDEIGFLGKTAHEFIRDLESIDGPIDLHLNSPGGEVFDGIAIYNTLLAREEVDVYIDGIAASIASVIAMAGRNVYIAPSAQFMVHNAFAMACGDASDMREMADRLDANTLNVAGIYAARTGKPADHWLKLMDRETWFMGQEAVDAGLADKVVHSARSVGAVGSRFDLSALHRGDMAARAASPDNAARHAYHGHFDIHHEPMTGTHTHNHACFGYDDGDDGIHDHSHTHSNDATHEHGHMSHDHMHDGHEHPHSHAHNAGEADSYGHAYNAMNGIGGGSHGHMHTHHDLGGSSDPDNDNDNDSTYQGDTDHGYWAHTGPGLLGASTPESANPAEILVGNRAQGSGISNSEKYSQADRDRMAKNGQAMPDGSYPIADAEDLSNAIHAVGRGKNNPHSAIRRHIIKRAKALGRSSEIPEGWSDSGSSEGASDHSETKLYNDADAAAFVSALKG